MHHDAHMDAQGHVNAWKVDVLVSHVVFSPLVPGHPAAWFRSMALFGTIDASERSMLSFEEQINLDSWQGFPVNLLQHRQLLPFGTP